MTTATLSAINLSGAIDAYLDDLIIEGRAKTTRRTYETMLKPARGYDWPLTPADCRALLRDRLDAGQALSSVALMHKVLCGFSRYCVARGWLSESPMAHVPGVKPKPTAHRYMTREQVTAVYAAARDDQERLIVRLLLTGMRSNELLGLRWRDVDADGRTLRVTRGKGGKQRLLPLDEAVALMLASVRRKGEFVVPMLYETLKNHVKALGKRAGVPWLRPHDFRRTWATQTMLLYGTGDLTTLRVLGGWSNDVMPSYYARSAMEVAAVERGRELSIGSRLIDELPEQFRR